jgi:hypothetical protein
MSEDNVTQRKLEKIQGGIKQLQSDERVLLKELGKIRAEQNRLMDEVILLWKVIRQELPTQTKEIE